MQPHNVKFRVVRDVIFICCGWCMYVRTCMKLIARRILVYMPSRHTARSQLNLNTKFTAAQYSVEVNFNVTVLSCVCHVHCAVVANERNLNLFWWAIDKPLLDRIFFFFVFMTTDEPICGYFNEQVNSAIEAMAFGWNVTSTLIIIDVRTYVRTSHNTMN